MSGDDEALLRRMAAHFRAARAARRYGPDPWPEPAASGPDRLRQAYLAALAAAGFARHEPRGFADGPFMAPFRVTAAEHLGYDPRRGAEMYRTVDAWLYPRPR